MDTPARRIPLGHALGRHRNALKSSPDVDQGWITYDFMDDHIVALSLAWTGLCVAAPATYLAKRRYWRGLRGMLLVSGIAVAAIGLRTLCHALGRGLAAATASRLYQPWQATGKHRSRRARRQSTRIGRAGTATTDSRSRSW
jgi:hypothetical protein